MPRTTKPQAEQTTIPGAIKSIPELDKQVKRLDQASAELTAAQEENQEIREEISDMMAERKLDVYKTPSGTTVFRIARGDLIRLKRDKPKPAAE